MNEARLIDIETKIAYQEHMISELNSVVIDQQTAIDDLKKTVQALALRVVEMSEAVAPSDSGPEKPPHY